MHLTLPPAFLLPHLRLIARNWRWLASAWRRPVALMCLRLRMLRTVLGTLPANRDSEELWISGIDLPALILSVIWLYVIVRKRIAFLI